MRGIRFIRVAVLSLATAAHPLVAHDSLYHYVEIRRDEAGTEVSFSVHAADLAGARLLGADPAGSDLEWLRGKEVGEIAALLGEARTFIAKTFVLSAGGILIDLTGDDLRLPEAALLVENPVTEAARPGFLVATLRLKPGSGEIELRNAATSDKRLLLVVSRTGAFPLVRDLAPGEGTSL